jgi:hypothetical protein
VEILASRPTVWMKIREAVECGTAAGRNDVATQYGIVEMKGHGAVGLGGARVALPGHA